MPPARAGLWTALLCLTVTAGCGGGSGVDASASLEGRNGLTPAYPAAAAPSSSVPVDSASNADGPTTTQPVASAPAATPVDAAGAEVPTPTEAALPRAAITDPGGDATPGPAATPAWADLVGAQLVALPEFFELRVQLAGSTPTAADRADRTMNVATFVDVDGDGDVDYEVWANLAESGWDGSWYDNVAGRSAHSEGAAMDVLVDGADLVVRFPSAYVGDATSFRWSMASEYGTYAALGTPRTARDDAPDGDVPVAFPQ
jgi:hypothetical protein